MNSRERVSATFEGKTTDKVPIHHLGFSSQIASLILGREAYVGGGIQQWREAMSLWNGEDAHREFLERSLQDAFDIAVAMDHDILRLEYWRMPTKPTKKIDDYTFLYGDPEKEWKLMRFDPQTELYQIIDKYPPQEEELTFESLERSVLSQEKALENFSNVGAQHAVSLLMEKFGKEYAIRISGGGLGIPYQSPIWLEAVALRPDIVARYLEVQAERAIRNIECLAQMQMVGAQHAVPLLIFGGGDFASNEGPFYSPKAFHELMLPRLKKIAETCHRNGMYYLFASDGNLWPVAADLFGDSGVDGYYEIDRRAGMELGKLRERYPNLTLIGNISSHTLDRGTKEDVVSETLSCLEEAKRSGRIIVGASNYIMPTTPLENLMAMIETIRKYRIM